MEWRARRNRCTSTTLTTSHIACPGNELWPPKWDAGYSSSQFVTSGLGRTRSYRLSFIAARGFLAVTQFDSLFVPFCSQIAQVITNTDRILYPLI